MFVVSPANARKQLASFIKGAKKELLIYDPKLSDKAMLRLIRERLEAGVKVRVIGEVTGKWLECRKLARLRLHTRTIIRDRKQAFVGSQSLRQLELDARREIGVIFRDASILAEMVRIFTEDWKASKKLAFKPPKIEVEKAAKKLVKVVHKRLPVKPVVKKVVKAIKKSKAKLPREHAERLVHHAIESSLKDAVKEAATEVVKEVVSESA